MIDFNLPEVEEICKLNVYIISNLLGSLDGTIAYQLYACLPVFLIDNKTTFTFLEQGQN